MTNDEWKKYTGKNIRVAVVDSGYGTTVGLEKNIDGLSIRKTGGDFKVDKDFSDEVGHGSAVCDVIRTVASGVDITCIKIFDKDLVADSDLLQKALEYVIESVDCRIVNISTGVVQSNNLKEIESLCRILREKGVLVVAAHSNDGAFSYPACSQYALGVEARREIRERKDYWYCENGVVNIYARGGLMRYTRGDGKEKILAGSNSYAAAIATGIVAKLSELCHEKSIDICTVIPECAKIIRTEETFRLMKNEVKIEKAVTFPWNKEIEVLHRNLDLTGISSIDAYDIKYSGNVGVKVDSGALGCVEIGNIEKLDWKSDFDTFILGHVKKISELVGVDYASKIAELCHKYGKALYLLDDPRVLGSWVSTLSREEGRLYSPYPTKDNIPKGIHGKLRYAMAPVVCICGTSSFQGKFSLQLLLRRMFLENGYRVVQLGTEPTGLLFRFDIVLPVGYGSLVDMSNEDFITYINFYIGEFDTVEKPDVIIFGTQGNTIPFLHTNTRQFNFYQNDFFLATNPDVVILCVNYQDNPEYVNRTIKYIEGLCNARVLACVMFPLQQETIWTDQSSVRTREIERAKLYRMCREKEQSVGRAVFVNGEKNDMSSLYRELIDYLNE